MENGLSWQEAFERTIASAKSLGSEEVPLRYSLSRVVEKEIIASENYPPYNVAQGKGYAVNSGVVNEKLQGGQAEARLRYGGHLSPALLKEKRSLADSAYLVSPGTLLPDWLDAVVDEAHASIDGNILAVRSEVKPFQEVVPAGSMVSQGEPSIGAGKKIDVAELGILSSQNLSTIGTVKLPTLGLVLTGNGLAEHSDPSPRKGTIRDILTPMLRGYCEKYNHPIITFGVRTEPFRDLLINCLEQVDVLLVAGFFAEGEPAELARHVGGEFATVVEGVRHPLGKRLLVAKRTREAAKWFIILPYHPVFAVALQALLVFPLLRAISGVKVDLCATKVGFAANQIKVLLEGDELWVGKLTEGDQEHPRAQVTLISQVSCARLSFLSQGNCIAISSKVFGEIGSGEELRFVLY